MHDMPWDHGLTVTDGESVMLEAPLQFAMRPAALRMRTALHHPGISPAARQPGAGVGGTALAVGLCRIVAGRASRPIDTAAA